MIAPVVAAPGAIDVLRRSLARERALYEVRVDGGEADWHASDASEPFDADVPLALAGAKRFFFPPRETLLAWHGDEVEAAVPPVRPFVLFGLRACDLTAIAYQDRFFAQDPWYARRRGAALLVGVNCRTACPGGFCVDVDAGPFARTGYDLSLLPLPASRLFVEVGSEAGREALLQARLELEPADANARATFEACRRDAVAGFPTRPYVGRAIRRVERGEVGDGEWQALGPACFACTGCTSLCPTCSCFTVLDESRGGEGERVRVWDSCLLEGFQREASGHHPAPRPGDRVRRFWYHKLSNDFAEFGRPGCVGCGRCDVTCPGSIGALRVLGALGA
jgi:formate hydrogenlyase subunit 6/NADH:ubiquinone oxidoreductase subunit I